MEWVGPAKVHLKLWVAWISTFPIKIQSLYVWGAWTLRVGKRELQGFHLRVLVAPFPFAHLNDLMETQEKNPKLPQKSFHPSGSWKRHLKHFFFFFAVAEADDSKCLKTPQSCKADSSLELTAQLWKLRWEVSLFQTSEADKSHWAVSQTVGTFKEIYLWPNFYYLATRNAKKKVSFNSADVIK